MDYPEEREEPYYDEWLIIGADGLLNRHQVELPVLNVTVLSNDPTVEDYAARAYVEELNESLDQLLAFYGKRREYDTRQLGDLKLTAADWLNVYKESNGPDPWEPDGVYTQENDEMPF